jgi:hypothetical protein
VNHQHDQANVSASVALVCVAVVLCFFAWMFTPEYILHPDREANPAAYSDAAKVFNQNDEGLQITGYCPSLSIMTAKALLDKRLTKREAHDLGEESARMQDLSEQVNNRNEALIAAGQPNIPTGIQCEHGRALFLDY